MSKWLKVYEAEYLKEDNEWNLVMQDITDLIVNYAKQYNAGNGYTISDPREYAARAIGMCVSHVERNGVKNK